MVTKVRAGSQHRNAIKSGFTLVELLVVIAIIGVLVALLLPAIQAAREAARRTQCQNNIKQLGIALHNYHDQFKKFPPSAEFDESAGSPESSQTHYKNWVIHILPFIEQQPLYDAFDLTRPISDPINREPRGVELGFMRCPSDFENNIPYMFEGEGDNWARGNYGANATLGAYSSNWGVDPNDPNRGRAGAGKNAPAWVNELTGGVMGANVARSISQIPDGTSQTILLGELRAGLHEMDRRGVWALGGPGSSSLWMHGSDDANSPNCCLPSSDNILGCRAIMNRVGEERLRAECMTCCPGCTSTQAVPRSVHPGGVYVCMVDSSVRFISDDIDTASPWEILHPNDLATWQRLNVVGAGQVIDQSLY